MITQFHSFSGHRGPTLLPNNNSSFWDATDIPLSCKQALLCMTGIALKAEAEQLHLASMPWKVNHPRLEVDPALHREQKQSNRRQQSRPRLLAGE